MGLAARGSWGDTVLPLPDGSWTDALTGTRVHGAPELSRLLSRYPAALLIRHRPSPRPPLLLPARQQSERESSGCGGAWTIGQPEGDVGVVQ